MKTNDPESPSPEPSGQRHPCYETTHKHSFALAVTADDGREHFFGTAQFLEAELAANPSIEKSAQASRERLLVRYATGEVIVLGRGLRRLAQILQRGELESLKPLGERYTWLRPDGPMITSITVTRKEVA